MSLDFCQELDHNIVRVDTGYDRPNLAAVYLIQAGDHAAFVDTGTYHCVPRFLQALDHYGIARTNVDYVIPTHAHLDHAGGAGELMRQLSHARLVAHPRAAPHLIDPTRMSAQDARLGFVVGCGMPSGTAQAGCFGKAAC